MFVDADLLRMGAGFSESAGIIARDGATRLAEAQLPSGIFGDFDAAHEFHRTLTRAHDMHITTMQGHRTRLDTLTEHAITAAATFTTQDEAARSSLEAASSEFA